jgi:protein TonB
MTPIAPPVTAPAPPAPAPAVMSAAVVCPNFTTAMGDAAFPKEAVRQGLEKGEAMVLFTLSASGEIKNVTIERASHAIFGRAGVRVVNDLKCQGQGRDVQVRVPFSFKLE